MRTEDAEKASAARGVATPSRARRDRLSIGYAKVVSTLALFLSLGGSAYAAIVVTGQNVKDGTLTGRDVRDASLGGRDVLEGSLRSSDVADGSLRAGDFAEDELAAPNDVIKSFKLGRRVSLNGATILATVDLPAGAWALSATGTYEGGSNARDSGCAISTRGGDGLARDFLAATGSMHYDADDNEPFALSGATTLAEATTVQLACSSTNRPGVEQIVNPSLTAIRVASVEDQTR